MGKDLGERSLLATWQGSRLPAAAGRVRTGQPCGKLLLVFDRVSFEKDASTIVTKSGIVLPENSQGTVW